jgi:hypothetical protein
VPTEELQEAAGLLAADPSASAAAAGPDPAAAPAAFVALPTSGAWHGFGYLWGVTLSLGPPQEEGAAGVLRVQLGCAAPEELLQRGSEGGPGCGSGGVPGGRPPLASPGQGLLLQYRLVVETWEEGGTTDEEEAWWGRECSRRGFAEALAIQEAKIAAQAAAAHREEVIAMAARVAVDAFQAVARAGGAAGGPAAAAAAAAAAAGGAGAVAGAAPGPVAAAAGASTAAGDEEMADAGEEALEAAGRALLCPLAGALGGAAPEGTEGAEGAVQIDVPIPQGSWLERAMNGGRNGGGEAAGSSGSAGAASAPIEAGPHIPSKLCIWLDVLLEHDRWSPFEELEEDSEGEEESWTQEEQLGERARAALAAGELPSGEPCRHCSQHCGWDVSITRLRRPTCQLCEAVLDRFLPASDAGS